MMTYFKQTLAAASLLFFLSGTTVASASETESSAASDSAAAIPTQEATTSTLTLRQGALLKTPTAKELPKKFFYDSGVEIAYPADGVKGIYVTAYSVGYEEKFNKLVDYVDSNDLNAMVIDIKDDMGVVTADFNSEDSHIQENTEEYIPDIKELMDVMEEKQIYPIARIVTFKDTLLANEQPEMSFTNSNGSVWKASNGESFINPFLKQTWDYAVNVGIEAAKAGFKEIQFDYVRFPEGFEVWGDTLNYDMGEYADLDMTDDQKRVQAITDFTAYAKEKLMPYGVDISVDIFGYTASVVEASGIGQNFPQISENVDVISSMIYPSHWGTDYFGIYKPDLYPYELVAEYIKVENELLATLETPPISRPWLQDFTASYLGSGFYQTYGKAQVDAQVQALYDAGVNEFLLWNALNNYTY
ncbi:putative glycoside hydrolase [uncultured Trichococcus sp.]|uniref:putative glycoside hydrolase n=1 Tax=uncultured Trichococcus sp. TaxID=189665 RepID=UPI0029C7554F|nr:putative glycoside hydrolase [uncultured Trichococcus sp.]